MSKPIKAAIVGCGGIARGKHIPAFKEMDNVEVVAVCDIIPERAAQAAEIFGGCRVFADWRELVAMPDLDLVDICTPNCWHAPIAIGAMKAGKHVFSEKPDAITVAEAQEMKETAERTGRHLMVMRNLRYREHSEYAKRFIEEGRCGDIYAGRCGYIRRRGIPGRGGWFTTKAQSGGGPLIDLGVHMIDLAMWMMGNPVPVAVSGSVYNKFASSDESTGGDAAGGTFDVEDLAIGLIRFDNGALLQVECSWASNIEGEKGFVELRGTQAGINWEERALTVYAEEYGRQYDIKPYFNFNETGHAENLQHFIDVITKGETPTFRPIHGLNMVKILCSLYESAALGREVVL
jgi:predicted dehydrogenase